MTMQLLNHSWDLTPKAAVALQRELAPQVVLRDEAGELRRIAGVDVGFEQQGKVTRAAVAVLSFPELELVEQKIVRQPTRFPYIPGLLSFREAPAVLAALAELAVVPDALLCDGQGYAHPRRFGIACHLGVVTGIPAIGVGKTRLTGRHGPVPDERGAWVPLEDRGEVIGAVLRSRQGVKPIFVSVGHKFTLDRAVAVVMACTTRYKLPETTRQAHRLASG